MNVTVQGRGRVKNPDTNVDTDWAWHWLCGDCGVVSRESSKELVDGWAANHRCGGPDHAALLHKYIQYVGECEGVDFLSYDRGFPDSGGRWTPGEWYELRRLAGYAE